MVKDFGSKFWHDTLRFLIGVMIIILVNQISAFSFFRIDLTGEKRYSIADASRELLRELDDVVYVEVYLDGDLPAGFRRMQKAIRETLEEFRVYAGENLQFSFVDPYATGDAQYQARQIVQLAEKGVQPTDVFLNQDGERIQKRILPGAVLSFGGMEKGVNLFGGNVTAPPQERLNQAIEEIEFRLISAIQDLSRLERRSVGLLKGHGELEGADLIAFRTTLNERYRVEDVYANDRLSAGELDALIVAKPQEPFTEEEKFFLDQYVMAGGKLLWLVDGVGVALDSIREGTIGFPLQLNLQDMLFRYGVRVNKDLVQDIISGSIPVVVGETGGAPQVRPMPWVFDPIINNFAAHPITRNMDAVKMRFASSLDSVGAPGIHKTPLLTTSGYTRRVEAPLMISLESLREDIPQDAFNEQNLPLGYLLEGTFPSLYRNRLLPEGLEAEAFRAESVPTKMAVYADGDLVRNEFDPRTGQPLPLGKDPYEEHQFANQALILNTLAYLLDGEGIIRARTKEIAIRPLDTVRIQNERTFWQVLNLVLPVILILALGLLLYQVRKRRYSS